MPAQVISDDCTGCGDCVSACPVDGVLVLESEKVVVNQEQCIECNACVDTCSSSAMKMAG